MKPTTRRSFLKTGAATAAAVSAVPAVSSGWFGFLRSDRSGYFESSFGISDSLCRRLLAKALSRGGDFADLYFEHTITNRLGLEDGIINQARSNVELGVGIRTVKGDQVGYGFTQELTEPSMLAAASTAATISDGPAVKPGGRFVERKMMNHYPLRTLLTSVPIDSRLPLVQSVNEQCFARSPLVVKVTAGFFDSQKRILVVSSDGIKAEDLLPSSYLYASVTAEKDGRREKAWMDLGGRRDFSFYTPSVVQEVAETAVDRALVLFDAIQPPAGEMPVVLKGGGEAGILLHEAIGHGMEADFNRKKTSTYCTMMGKKVAEPIVSIVDDGTNPHTLGALNVDDEGTPGRKTVLVDQGILSSYMHDRISARHYNVKPTGNGRRQSYQHVVQPRMRDTYMAPGSSDPQEVIQNVQKGIYVQNVGNGQVKIGEGDFAFYVSQGRMIENGRLTAPIKDVNIMGNGPEMLRNITMVADDLQLYQGGACRCGKGGQWVQTGFGMPTCLVKSMTVGGTQA